MAPYSAKTEREKKLKSLLSFAKNLTHRFEASRDATLLDDLQSHIRSLPLQVSSTVAAKQNELDKVGTELWNLSTRFRRDDSQPNGKTKEETAQRNQALCLLRVFSFFLLDTAGGQVTRARERSQCIRLLKVALKAARVCIENNELSYATKVLERAASYQEMLDNDEPGEAGGERQLVQRVRMEYCAVRTTLAWRQDRMDIAENMYSKSMQLRSSIDARTVESFADLLYEIGKDLLAKRKYELSVKWLERAQDILGEQDLETLGPEAGELQLGIMQSIVQAYMKLKTSGAQSKAWDMVQLLENDYGDKMAVQLLKLELLSAAEAVDSIQYYGVLVRMIRTVVLNETNFRTIMHHVHRLKDYNNLSACKALDELVGTRLFREENQTWIEKALITRIWVGTTTSSMENSLETLRDLFEGILRNTKYPLSAPATHAAQTLLWKRVEAGYNQDQFAVAESWCHICLHPLFERAGEVNKSRIARKLILCALARQDYGLAREVFLKMSDTGRNEPVTRYLMYKTALHTADADFAAECLDLVCRQATKDATLLYACVLEAQRAGDKRQGIIALEKVLEKYDYSAPKGVHLPILLRCTARLLIPELTKDGTFDQDILEEICKLLEGACTQAKASRRRPTNPAQELFTPSEFEWFSKSAYSLALKHCAEMHSRSLVRLLDVCAEFIKLLKDHDRPEDGDLLFRLMLCDFLAACALTTLARAEDNIQNSLQYYLQVRKHCQQFRKIAADELQSEKHSPATQVDIMAKHGQMVKVELEAALKLENWDALDDIFEECWKYDNPGQLETIADLVLVMYSCMINANVDGKYQGKLLSVLQKIINLTWRQTNNDIITLSRWIRCLFQLALTFDESISLKCMDQASQIAAARQGVSPDPKSQVSFINTPPPSSSPAKVADDGDQEANHYPTTELEWLATTSFNHAVDYYLQENDAQCKAWAEKGIQLAQWAEDGGRLRDLLMEKYSGLVWQD